MAEAPPQVVIRTIEDLRAQPQTNSVYMLPGADLSGAVLTNADLRGANLYYAVLTEANLNRANLYYADLTGAELTGAELTGANLRDADLREANLNRANLTGARLRRVDLTVADLIGAELTGTDLRDANLTGARLIGANLTGANLTGANLTEADLREANLTGANLTGANLTDADLTDANLTDADLTDANLTGADLTDANLTGVVLTGAIYTEPTEFTPPAPSIAFEIHRATNKVNMKTYMDFLLASNARKQEETSYIQSMFFRYMDARGAALGDVPRMKDELTRVLKKFNLVPEYANDLHKNQVIRESLHYVFEQDPAFIDYYVQTFIQDTTYAYPQNPNYPDDHPNNVAGRISCVPGIYERFFMLVGETARAMCPETECANPEYQELKRIFQLTTFDVNEAIRQWFEDVHADLAQRGAESPYRNHPPEYFRSLLRVYVTEQYTKIHHEDPSPDVLNAIERGIDGVMYVFENPENTELEFGGGKRKRRKQTHRKTRRTHRKTRRTR